MSSNVEEIWRLQEGTAVNEIVYGASVGADDSFFLAGYTSGDWGAVGEGGRDMVAVKIGANGSLLWEWQEGSVGDDYMFAAAAMDDGGVVVAGRTNGSWNNVASLGDTDFAAVKLDSEGTVEWRWQNGTEEYDVLYDCAATTDGNVVLVGLTLGDWIGTQEGYYVGMAVKLNADDGTVLWSYMAGLQVGSVFISAVAARFDGSVVLAGYTDGAWGDAVLDTVGTTDFIAVALDADGEELWRWQDGAAGGLNYIFSATALDDGSVVLVGSTEGDWSSENAGGSDFAAVTLTYFGVEEARWQEGSELNDDWQAVATNVDGTSVVMAGTTFGSWASLQLGTDDDSDFAAMSMDGAGTVLFRYQAGTTENDDFNAAAATSNGTALLAGWTEGEWATTASFPADFAGVLVDTGSQDTTPSPSSATPSPAPLTSTISPTPRVPTPSPTPLIPTPSPTLTPSTPSPLLVPSTPSPTSLNPTSSPPLVLIIGGVVAGVLLLVILGLLLIRRRGKDRVDDVPPTSVVSEPTPPPPPLPAAVAPAIGNPPPYCEPPAYRSQRWS